MKRRNSKKLRLHRETLTLLTRGSLAGVRGGAQSLNPEETDCQRDLTIPDSVCILCGGGTLQSCNPCYTGANTCPEHTC